MHCSQNWALSRQLAFSSFSHLLLYIIFFLLLLLLLQVKSDAVAMTTSGTQRTYWRRSNNVTRSLLAGNKTRINVGKFSLPFGFSFKKAHHKILVESIKN